MKIFQDKINHVRLIKITDLSQNVNQTSDYFF